MSWRCGGTLFWEVWPLVKRHIPDDELRKEFSAKLLDLFFYFDVDPCEIEGDEPEIDALMADR